MVYFILCDQGHVHVSAHGLFLHSLECFSQGTDRTDQIEFLKQLRVISDNAKLGRCTFLL